MTKKDFKKNAAELFISAAEEPQKADVEITREQPKTQEVEVTLVREQPKTQEVEVTLVNKQAGVTIPKGYRLVKELKSERMQLLVRKATKEAIKNAAAAQGISMNDFVNTILDEYVERQGLV